MNVTQHWTIAKPSAAGVHGVVTAQSRAASEAGRAILEAGGSAADAAVAMAFCLATSEPWNSGLGGVGFGLVRTPDGQVETLDFGPKSPSAAMAALYPLSKEKSADIFGWAKVEGDRNIHGPLSFCMPSAVAGYGQLHERYGRLPWRDVVLPAVELARQGMVIDWFSVTKICQKARMLRLYETARQIYLPDNLPPTIVEYGTPERLQQGNLAKTLERLALGDWRDFYAGEIAEDLRRDFAETGAIISRGDLEACEAQWRPSDSFTWRNDGTLHHPGNLTGAPALADVVGRMNQAEVPAEPDEQWFCSTADALSQAFRTRMSADRQTCTTHLIATDAQGMTVTLTTTLLGLMGSGVVLARTGVLMNNGMMWFNPEPGSRNGIGPSKRPLANMLPVVFAGKDGSVIAGGASGGRRILSSVYQMLAFLQDFGMDPERAAVHPRIDASTSQAVGVDRRLQPAIIAGLKARFPVKLLEHSVAPLNFGCPSFVVIRDDRAIGISDAMTPWSAALAASSLVPEVLKW